jgi:uncharacterized repeat protein (TIGR01451 family)
LEVITGMKRFTLFRTPRWGRAAGALAAGLALCAAAAPASARVPVQQGGTADIAVTKTDAPDPVVAGNTITYTITVVNNGPNASGSVNLVDVTPPNTTFQSLTAPLGWSCGFPPAGGTGNVLCSTPSMAPGAVATFTLVLSVNSNTLSGTLIANEASATASIGTIDPNLDNNRAEAVTTVTTVGAAPGTDTPAAYVPATRTWFLRNTNTAGPANLQFSYGPSATARPISGNWDANATDTPGAYLPATGAFFLKNTNAPGGADIDFRFGPAGTNWIPLAGDWDGDGRDTVGLYNPTTGVFFLKNANTAGPADAAFRFGPAASGWTPIAGDWDGDGLDTIGLYDPATRTFFLRNLNQPGPADLTFVYGGAGSVPVVGDWNGDGVDTVGTYVPATRAWFLRNTNSAGVADFTFVYGPANVVPLKGDWDGQ